MVITGSASSVYILDAFLADKHTEALEHVWCIHDSTRKKKRENLFCKGVIYLFLESREGREKERARNINVWLTLVCPLLGTWPAAQARALDW